MLSLCLYLLFTGHDFCPVVLTFGTLISFCNPLNKFFWPKESDNIDPRFWRGFPPKLPRGQYKFLLILKNIVELVFRKLKGRSIFYSSSGGLFLRKMGFGW